MAKKKEQGPDGLPGKVKKFGKNNRSFEYGGREIKLGEQAIEAKIRFYEWKIEKRKDDAELVKFYKKCRNFYKHILNG